MDHQDNNATEKVSQEALNKKLLKIARGRFDDAQLVQQLIAKGADPSAKADVPYSSNPVSALYLACKCKHVGIVKVLVSHLNEDAINEEFFTLIHSTSALDLASSRKLPEMVFVLINAGAHVKFKHAKKAFLANKSDNLFQLCSAMSPNEINRASAENWIRWLYREPVDQHSIQTLACYDNLRADFTNRLGAVAQALNIPEGNFMGRNTALLGMIAGYAFPECRQEAFAARMVQSAVENVPLSTFSEHVTRKYYHARRTMRHTLNAASQAASSAVSRFFSSASVPATEDNTAEQQSHSKKRRMD